MPITTGQITIESFLSLFETMVERKRAAGIEAIQNNPPDLLERAQTYGVQYKNGSWGWSSNIWNRSAPNTEVIESDHELQPEHQLLMLRVLEQMMTRPMIQVDTNLGSPGSPVEMRCRMYCDPQFPDIAYRWQQLSFPGDPEAEPDARLFFIPHYLENPDVPGKPGKMLRVLRFPHHGYSICVGSSYQGEVKKGFLSHWIFHCYQRGGTGEHASLREFTLEQVDGKKKRITMGVWGLTGSGKSTHGLYIFNRAITEPYYKETFGLDLGSYVTQQAIKNDDITSWFEDRVYSPERGAWTKTEDVNEKQVAIYRAAMSPRALHENTEWDEEGNVSFEGRRFQYHAAYNANARTVMQLEDTGYFDGTVDSTQPPNVAVFISPGYLCDYAWLKINDPLFAAKVLADGRTVGHPADSKEGVGETKYVSRYCSPFTMGVGNAEHVHRFLEFLLKRQGTEDPILIYQINTTGKVGAKYEWLPMNLDGEDHQIPRVVLREKQGRKRPVGGTEPSIEETELFLIQALRGAVKYEPHPIWGEKVLVPVEVEGLTKQRLAELNPFTYRSYEEMEALLQAQILLSKYYLARQCAGVDRDIYYAMDF
jgi:phosphoenolpyruvate carboxykinase (ATP)